jgi:hypothetical protein
MLDERTCRVISAATISLAVCFGMALAASKMAPTPLLKRLFFMELKPFWKNICQDGFTCWIQVANV